MLVISTAYRNNCSPSDLGGAIDARERRLSTDGLGHFGARDVDDPGRACGCKLS